MRSEQMKNEKRKMKRGLLFLFSFLTFLLSCNNPFETPPEAGYGRVTVLINGAAARTVFPTMAFAKYEYLFAKVVNGTPGTPQAQTPVEDGGSVYFMLELGDWQVTVNAYARAGDTGPSATGVSATFTVTHSAAAQVEIKLNGNAEIGEGKFVYAITYPAGTAISAFSLKNLHNNAVININTANGRGTRENVPAGYYFLTIQLTQDGGSRTTGSNEVVYIYDKLDSEYHKTFTPDDFSHIHDWNTAYTTITAVTATTDGIEAITCKQNASHTKDIHIFYATGTAGLGFDAIGSPAAAYRVRRGTATGAIYIPVYYRPNPNSPYLPVTEIGNGTNSDNSNAFGGTSSNSNTTVTAVTFAPQSQLTTISDYAFYRCSNLTGSITLPASVTSIGDYAFAYCSNLTGSITLPASVTSIGDYAFAYCYSPNITVDVNNPHYSSEGGILYNKAKTEIVAVPQGISGNVTLPAGVTSIGDYVFAFCTSLTGITLPAGVTTIGVEAFSYCQRLTNITLPAGLTSIGDGAFNSCSSLTNITLPASLTTIGDYVFVFCSSLTNVTLPQGVTSIGDGLFSYCSSLTSVTLPASLTSIGNGAFYGCHNLTNITLPASVTSIGNEAFNSCRNLTNITLPAGVTSIGDYAFNYCSGLTNITIPAGVTSIGQNAFNGCSSLTSVTFEGTINADNFSSTSPFPGNLRSVYLASGGGPGTYTRSGSAWTKQ